MPSMGSSVVRNVFVEGVSVEDISDRVPPIPMAGYSLSKDDYLTRLRRIEGQVRGLQRLVDEDTYCIDVLTQISSVTKALQGVGVGLLDEHIRHCVRNAVLDGDDAGDAKIDEAITAIERLLRS
jgi:DNA-binding FrmR family transcriptional regulator